MELSDVAIPRLEVSDAGMSRNVMDETQQVGIPLVELNERPLVELNEISLVELNGIPLVELNETQQIGMT